MPRLVLNTGLAEKNRILIPSSSPVLDPGAKKMRRGDLGLGSTGFLVISYVDFALQAGLDL